MDRHQEIAPGTLVLQPERRLSSDLEITGMVTNGSLPRMQYLSRNDLLRLPQVTMVVRENQNLGVSGHMARVRGVSLQRLAQALGGLSSSALIDVECSDRYRAYFTSAYIAAHRPVLAVTVDNLSPTDWAQKHREFDAGPYFILYHDFAPTFQILAHKDEPLEPTGIVRLNFTSDSEFNAIKPRGDFAPGSPEQNGFIIAKQNCLRCHFSQSVGGRKSGRDWSMLSVWAHEQPAYFARYVRNPVSVEPHAQMPANPDYDAATLSALTAYFRTFSMVP